MLFVLSEQKINILSLWYEGSKSEKMHRLVYWSGSASHIDNDLNADILNTLWSVVY